MRDTRGTISSHDLAAPHVTGAQPRRSPQDEGDDERPKTVIFDCDGVLLDTGGAWSTALTTAAATVGLLLNTDHLHHLLGTPAGTAAAAISHWATSQSTAAARRSPSIGPRDLEGLITGQLLAALTDEPPTQLPGVQNLLAALDTDLPLAVASNAPSPVLRQVLASTGLTKHFTCVLSADDVEHPKPAPDVYLAAAAALGLEPRACLALEDSPVGAAAALAAGMPACVITEGPREEFTSLDHARPTFFARSLQDPALFALIQGTEATA